MALIPDLPAATTVASTDVFIKDTGSATNKITAPNLANGLFGAATSPLAINKGGSGQAGQTAQTSWVPTITISSSPVTISSVSALYKSWGLMKLLGGRFSLESAGTGSLNITLPTGFAFPSQGVQAMGVLIDPNQKAYHIRISSSGLVALSNGGGNVAWPTGYYVFTVVCMAM